MLVRREPPRLSSWAAPSIPSAREHASSPSEATLAKINAVVGAEAPAVRRSGRISGGQHPAHQLGLDAMPAAFGGGRRRLGAEPRPWRRPWHRSGSARSRSGCRRSRAPRDFPGDAADHDLRLPVRAVADLDIGPGDAVAAPGARSPSGSPPWRPTGRRSARSRACATGNSGSRARCKSGGGTARRDCSIILPIRGHSMMSVPIPRISMPSRLSVLAPAESDVRSVADRTRHRPNSESVSSAARSPEATTRVRGPPLQSLRADR